MKKKKLKAVQPQIIIATYQYGDYLVNVFGEDDEDISIWITRKNSGHSFFVVEFNPIPYLEEGKYKNLRELICKEVGEAIDDSILEDERIIEWYNSDTLMRMKQGIFYK